MKKFIITAISCFVPTTSFSQTTDRHSVYWLRYANQLIFSPRLSWVHEFDNRRFISPDVENQFIFHSRVHYKYKRWDFGGGLTLSWAYSTKAQDHIKHATMEVRPTVEVNYDIPLKNWTLQQRLRIDNRFIEENKYETVFDGSDYVMRFRYRLQARIPLIKNQEKQATTVLKAANEIMLNHRENTFDQDRVYLSAEQVLNKKWSIEPGFIYIYQHRLGKNEFLERYVLRFSLIHKLFVRRS
jgi:hypothetical protein